MLKIGQPVLIKLLGDFRPGKIRAIKIDGILEIPEDCRSFKNKFQFTEYDVFVEHNNSDRQYGLYQSNQIVYVSTN